MSVDKCKSKFHHHHCTIFFLSFSFRYALNFHLQACDSLHSPFQMFFIYDDGLLINIKKKWDYRTWCTYTSLLYLWVKSKMISPNGAMKFEFFNWMTMMCLSGNLFSFSWITIFINNKSNNNHNLDLVLLTVFGERWMDEMCNDGSYIKWRKRTNMYMGNLISKPLPPIDLSHTKIQRFLK